MSLCRVCKSEVPTNKTWTSCACCYACFRELENRRKRAWKKNNPEKAAASKKRYYQNMRKNSEKVSSFRAKARLRARINVASNTYRVKKWRAENRDKYRAQKIREKGASAIARALSIACELSQTGV